MEGATGHIRLSYCKDAFLTKQCDQLLRLVTFFLDQVGYPNCRFLEKKTEHQHLKLAISLCLSGRICSDVPLDSHEIQSNFDIYVALGKWILIFNL
jgi:hypothetical protein